MSTPRELLAQYVTANQLSNTFTDTFGLHNVKSYGAEGDGATNDTEAVNDAVAAVIASSGNALYYPSGTYVVTAASLSSDFADIYHYGNKAAFSGSTMYISRMGQFITNSTGIPRMGLGVTANRPSSSTALTGEVYIDTTLDVTYYYNSSEWSETGGISSTDVLARLKTVDGTGSGLDADLVQGVDVVAKFSTGSTAHTHDNTNGNGVKVLAKGLFNPTTGHVDLPSGASTAVTHSLGRYAVINLSAPAAAAGNAAPDIYISDSTLNSFTVTNHSTAAVTYTVQYWYW